MIIRGDIVTDSILFFLVAFITFIVRMVFKPSEGQVKLLSNILVSLFYLVLAVLKNMHDEHKQTFSTLEAHIQTFKNKINKKRVGLG